VEYTHFPNALAAIFHTPWCSCTTLYRYKVKVTLYLRFL